MERNIYSSANTSTINVYNLSEKTRNALWKDINDGDNFKRIELKAGYGKNLATIFVGNVQHAFSVRRGTEFITTIQSYDGGYAFANSDVSLSFKSGTLQRNVVKTIVKTLGNFGVTEGAIGNYPGTIQRGNSYSGNATDLLRDLTGGGFFIDNGKANCLGESECIDSSIRVIKSSTGLLGSPVREFTKLHLEMIFYPDINIGDRVRLESITNKNFNGLYKVDAVSHRGVISDTVGGSVVTKIIIFYGPQALRVVQQGS